MSHSQVSATSQNSPNRYTTFKTVEITTLQLSCCNVFPATLGCHKTQSHKMHSAVQTQTLSSVWLKTKLQNKSDLFQFYRPKYFAVEISSDDSWFSVRNASPTTRSRQCFESNAILTHCVREKLLPVPRDHEEVVEVLHKPQK